MRFVKAGLVCPMLFAAVSCGKSAPPSEPREPPPSSRVGRPSMIALAGEPPTGTKGATGQPPAEPPATGTPRRFALLVGVKEYEQDAGLSNLQYPEADVNTLRDTLLAAGYRAPDVVVLTKSAAEKDPTLLPTAENIKAKLGSLCAACRPDDLLMVVLTGHGIQKSEDEQFFCPQGADCEDETTLVAMAEISDELGKCRAGMRILLVDACRTSPGSRRRKVSAGQFNTETGPKYHRGVITYFSCSKDESSYELDKLEHGLFCYMLNEGLAGKADLLTDGEVSWSELITYVNDRVRKYGEESGYKQTPHFKGDVTNRIPVVVYDRESGPPILTGPPKLLDSTQGDLKPEEVRKIQQQWAKYYGVDEKVSVPTRGRPMEFVLIPPGIYNMGTQRRVEITKPFYMSAHEVTQAQYQAATRENPSRFVAAPGKPSTRTELRGVTDTKSFPVETVSHSDAEAFAKACRGPCDGIRTLKGKVAETRLPTEAEWELAARAGTDSTFADGKDELTAADANFGNKFRRATDVGQFTPNVLGLYDMHGNVQEWCLDVYEEDLGAFAVKDPVTEPDGRRTGSAKFVVRGGSYVSDAFACAVDNRQGYRGSFATPFIGFRVAIALAERK